MKVLKLTASKSLEEKVSVKEIDGELESLQAEVNGGIEFFEIKIGGKHFDVILNDEGKLIGLQPNIAVYYEGKLTDLIVGDVIVAAANDEGETIGLTDQDIALLTNYFSHKGVVTSNGILSYCEL